ncbi:hypothetical protein Q8F55_005963 [Vanrija albida]|uniref:Serine-rich protein n=1 Tax=Vanrija albida TaxID=181172 RepID=A0ABR3Q329_9TREE
MAPRTSPSASPTPSTQQRRSKVAALKAKATSPKAKPAAPPSPKPSPLPTRPPRSSLRASAIVPLSRASVVSLTPSERSLDSDDPFTFDTRVNSKRRSTTVAARARPAQKGSPRASALRHTTSNSSTSHSSISLDLNGSTLGLIHHAEPPSLSHGHSDSTDSGTSSESARPLTPPGPISDPRVLERDFSTPSLESDERGEFVKHARTDSGLPKHVRTDSDLQHRRTPSDLQHKRTDSGQRTPSGLHTRTDSDLTRPPARAYTADKVRRKPVPSGAPPPLADLAGDDALEHLELELELDATRRPNRPRVLSVGSMDALSMYSDVAHRMSVAPGEVVPGSAEAAGAPMYVLAVDPPLRTTTPQAQLEPVATRTRQRSETVSSGRPRAGTGVSARYELARNLPHPDTISMYSTVARGAGTPRESFETGATAVTRGVSGQEADEVKYAVARAEPYTLARTLWRWGWLFPPLWLFGSFLICIPLTVQDAPSDMEKAPGLGDMVAIVRQTELKYARRCRNAFAGFMVLVVAAVVAAVLALTLKH